MRILFRVEVEGVSNIPPKGPLIVCPNHVSMWDPPLVAVVFPRQVFFMGKKELFKTKISSAFFHALGAFPVDRERTDVRAIRTAITLLREGKALGVFPEGTRQKGEGTLGEIHKGVALLALRGPAPFLPVLITGKYRFRNRIVVRIGSPLTIDKTGGKPAEDVLAGTSQVQKAMESLMDSPDQAGDALWKSS